MRERGWGEGFVEHLCDIATHAKLPLFTSMEARKRMDTLLKTGIWQQFGAAMDTFDDALSLCPDHLWTVKMWDDPDDPRYGQFWYIAYHTLSWTDLFLTSTYKE